MSNTNANNKSPKGEIILVATSGQALLATGALVNPASFALNIANGQLGAMVATHQSSTRAYGDMLQAGDVVPDVDVIQIVQGTPYSSDIKKVHPVDAIDHKAVVKSHKINAKNRMIFSARVSKQATNDAWVLGNTPASAGEITISDNGVYKLNVQFVSVRNDKSFGAGEENLTVSFTAPDYTVLATVDPLDHLIKNIVFNANLNSAALDFNNPSSRRGNKNFVALAVSKPGAGGTTLASITPGTQFQIATSTNGQAVYFLPDADFAATIENVIASGDLSGASTIEIANLTSAGNAVGADSILLVGTDHGKAFVRDEISQVKTRLRVGLQTNFIANAIKKENVSKPFEGEGQGAKWKLVYDQRYGLNIYSAQNRSNGRDLYITPPSYIDTTLDYTAYVIDHKDEYIVQASHVSDYFYRTIILVPSVVQPETFTFLVTTDPSGADDVTFNINGTAYNVTSLTNTANPAAAAAEIKVRWDALGFDSDYELTVNSATITFVATDTNPKSGGLSLTNVSTGLAGTFTTTVQGGSFVTDPTVKASLNAVLGPWLQSAYDLNLIEGSYPKVGNVAGAPAPNLGTGVPFI
jgi:hypothetical protein